MVELPPNWAFTIYARLWKAFETKGFSSDDARAAIDDPKLPQAFSRLRKEGWLTIQLDDQDARRSIYHLHRPDYTILKLIDEKAQDTHAQTIQAPRRKTKAPRSR